MSLYLLMVCAECREEAGRFDIYLEAGPPPIWRLDYNGSEGVRELEYFLLAHRGHVIGMIDEHERDRVSPDEDPLAATWSLEELREKHPVDLDEVNELAPASALLSSLLRPRSSA